MRCPVDLPVRESCVSAGPARSRSVVRSGLDWVQILALAGPVLSLLIVPKTYRLALFWT